MTTQNAARLIAQTYSDQRDHLLVRAALIIEAARGRNLTDREAAAVETLYCEAGTLDNRVDRLQRVADRF